MNELTTKKMFIFDLDDTLTPSKSPLEPEMAETLSKLLRKVKVAVISGGTFEQFTKQFVGHLDIDDTQMCNLFLLPTSGTRLYTWDNTWKEVYAENIPPDERLFIINSLMAAYQESGTVYPGPVYGLQVDDRGSQITFSALGQDAPLELKKSWDPDRQKRQKIIDILSTRLQNYNIKIGGTTSIDVTVCGHNKAYGIEKFSAYSGINKKDMLFFGDSIFPGGNDASVCDIDIACVKVRDTHDTRERLESMLQ